MKVPQRMREAAMAAFAKSWRRELPGRDLAASVAKTPSQPQGGDNQH